MAEIIQKDGTWVFDGDALRLTPGHDKSVSLLRRTLGELVVPLGGVGGGLVRAGPEERAVEAAAAGRRRSADARHGRPG
ncbi:hypothetical protein GCM10020256_49380 [Streptomyces thermocoprophilus]